MLSPPKLQQGSQPASSVLNEDIAFGQRAGSAPAGLHCPTTRRGRNGFCIPRRASCPGASRSVAIAKGSPHVACLNHTYPCPRRRWYCRRNRSGSTTIAKRHRAWNLPPRGGWGCCLRGTTTRSPASSPLHPPPLPRYHRLRSRRPSLLLPGTSRNPPPEPTETITTTTAPTTTRCDDRNIVSILRVLGTGFPFAVDRLRAPIHTHPHNNSHNRAHCSSLRVQLVGERSHAHMCTCASTDTSTHTRVYTVTHKQTSTNTHLHRTS